MDTHFLLYKIIFSQKFKMSSNTSGETDLSKMLATLKPIHRPGVFVFTTVSAEDRENIPNIGGHGVRI